jgi:hypothetical protein
LFFGLLRVEGSELHVDARGGLLHQHQRRDELARHLLFAHVKEVQRALRLRAPQALRGDLEWTKRVFLGAGRHERQW